MRRKRRVAAGILALALANVAIAAVPRVARAATEADNYTCYCTGDGDTRQCQCASYFQDHCWSAFFCYLS